MCETCIMRLRKRYLPDGMLAAAAMILREVLFSVEI